MSRLPILRGIDSSRRALSVNEFCREHDFSKTFAYKEFNAGRLYSVKKHGRRLIPKRWKNGCTVRTQRWTPKKKKVCNSFMTGGMCDRLGRL